MKQHSNKNRPSADATRERILKAAQSLFVKQGFAGTSISQIANKAKVNQSLIYHHFESKQQLWKHVKTYLLSHEADIHNTEHPTNLQTFLQETIRQRFMIYLHNPDLARMIAWQRLESSAKELVGNFYLGPEQWRKIVIGLQQSGEIRLDLDADIIITLILSIFPGAFMPHNPYLADGKYKSEACVQQVIDCLYRALRPDEG
ncbi:N/A [soil metagenome]